MEHLPPVGWADVATKHDLDHQRELLELKMDIRFERVEARFASMDGRFDGVDGRLAALEGSLGEITLELRELRAAAKTQLIAIMGLMVSLTVGMMAVIKF